MQFLDKLFCSVVINILFILFSLPVVTAGAETLEYKKTTGEIKEAMISISSILNKHGIGTLYFGVRPNH